MPLTPRTRLRHEAAPIKGSRFIATVAPVDDAEAARRFVDEMQAQMPDATHHCWALRLLRPVVERAVDAGEPSGSAGRPILAAMIGRDVTDACVVVTRYYGGTKLGVGGLVRAYGGAAAAVLDLAELVPRVETEAWEIEHRYEDGPSVERALLRLAVTVLATEFGEQVRRRVQVPVPRAAEIEAALLDASAGRVVLRRG